MRQFLYRIQPVRPEMLTEGATESESQVISEHFSYLKGLMERGVVMMAGRTETTEHGSFGIVIFKAESENYTLTVSPCSERRTQFPQPQTD